MKFTLRTFHKIYHHNRFTDKWRPERVETVFQPIRDYSIATQDRGQRLLCGQRWHQFRGPALTSGQPLPQRLFVAKRARLRRTATVGQQMD